VIEVGDVFLNDAVKMALAEYEEVVKALSAETPQEAFTDSVGLWRPDWCCIASVGIGQSLVRG
jgi:hypothetical protein